VHAFLAPIVEPVWLQYHQHMFSMRIDPAVDDADGGLGLVGGGRGEVRPSIAARQCRSSGLPCLPHLPGKAGCTADWTAGENISGLHWQIHLAPCSNTPASLTRKMGSP
jgi:hypothetical protein